MKKIAVVEDDKELLETITEYLKDEGWKVLGIGNARQAVNKILTFRPNVVLMDVVIGNKYGYELTEQLEKQDEGIHSKIILMSSDRKYEKYVLEQELHSFLPKPFQFQQLEYRLDSVEG